MKVEKIIEQNNIDVVIYHDNCMDGWSAAYIAKQKYPNAKLLPQNYGFEPPYKEVEGKDVLVVDFSWNTREENDKMASLAKTFFILDHHKTAQIKLKDAPYAIFDMNRSGAGLAWDYLFGLPRPLWIDYVEDRDLWKYRLPCSKEVNAYISMLPQTIEAWDSLSKLPIKQMTELGRGILDYIEQNVQRTIKEAQTGSLSINEKCYRVALVNTSWNHSDIGNALAKNADIGMVWCEYTNGMMRFSLRSLGEIDVSEIAKIFGGGGHKNASGFTLPVEFGRFMIDQIRSKEGLKFVEGGTRQNYPEQD